MKHLSRALTMPLCLMLAACGTPPDVATLSGSSSTMPNNTAPIVTSVIGDTITIGHVTLAVRDLETMKTRYNQTLGFDIISENGSSTTLGQGTTPLLTLQEEIDSEPRTPASAGLYHVAYLYATQEALAHSLVRVIQSDPRSFQGSADHSVSEAFYFGDPEGNGIELYYDRDPSTWQWNDGTVTMGSNYLDVADYVSRYATPTTYDDSMGIGHIHLQVGDLVAAKEFYVDILGLDITSDMSAQGALFVSAGGYHHHIGLNTWNSRGAGPRPDDQYGLDSVAIALPTQEDYDALIRRLQESGVDFVEADDTLTVADPWNNHIVFSVE